MVQDDKKKQYFQDLQNILSELKELSNLSTYNKVSYNKLLILSNQSKSIEKRIKENHKYIPYFQSFINLIESICLDLKEKHYKTINIHILEPYRDKTIQQMRNIIQNLISSCKTMLSKIKLSYKLYNFDKYDKFTSLIQSINKLESQMFILLKKQQINSNICEKWSLLQVTINDSLLTMEQMIKKHQQHHKIKVIGGKFSSTSYENYQIKRSLKRKRIKQQQQQQQQHTEQAQTQENITKAYNAIQSSTISGNKGYTFHSSQSIKDKDVKIKQVLRT